MIPLRVVAVTLACIAAPVLGASPGSAQSPGEATSYPNRIVRLVVPFPPGGPADVIARFVGQKLTEHWGQTVVIENRPGGNTAIAAQQVARAAPDGHTLLVPMDTTMVLNPLLMPNLPYDPLKDFVPITMLTKNMSIVVTRMAGPKSIDELIARAKARPGTMNMGAGTITSRLGAVLFAKAAGIDVQLIPFKGSAEIGQAVLAGTVDFALDSTGTALPLVQGGQYRALAKYTNQPLPQFPGVPSLSEAAGLPSIDESSTWIALAAPAGTPRAIVDKIQNTVARIYADPATLQKLEKIGINPINSTADELVAHIRSESVRWSRLLKENKHLLRLEE
ncbi:MAG: tripartite tricarboxylate transporter substrate binding protein [Hyphomicrobiales bacterium]|nr:tripartite tricarboxylate transporter substrate binding protein [Hyphomicrobiales bacterium]